MSGSRFASKVYRKPLNLKMVKMEAAGSLRVANGRWAAQLQHLFISKAIDVAIKTR